MTLDRTLIARCFGQYLLAAGLFLAGMAIASAQPMPKNFILHEAPKPIASIAFEDGQGRPRSLAEFRGKVVLLNIWATWCGPCRREMPSLDRLQRLLGGADFEVVALSIDRTGLEVVRKFYADVGIRNLAIYIDSSGRATRELATVGVPATLLIDRTGRELGRLVGPAEWDEPDIVQFLKRVIAQQTGSAAPTNRLGCADGRTAPIAGPSARPGGTA
ncbi:MAG: TlpA family protein disulfide reductase [Xanthobacteraceae bacterium]|nr:TlpA family protein disulfide reductase [Xanthobacteraceae bacterium]